MSEGITTVATDAGMLALWRASAFAGVDGYAAWEREVNERLPEAIERGELVPIGIQGDGAFGVRVVVAPEAPNERELRHTVVTSEAYLLVADGGAVFVSGVEAVGDAQSSPITVHVPEGRYSVRVSLIAWDEEAGGRGSDGKPTEDALADFPLLIAPSNGSETFRISEVTFDPPA